MGAFITACGRLLLCPLLTASGTIVVIKELHHRYLRLATGIAIRGAGEQDRGFKNALSL